MSQSKLRVAIISTPWLNIPPKGYRGGIETVLDGLITGLKAQGVEVEVFSLGETKLRGVKVHSLYKTEQYTYIHRPMKPYILSTIYNAVDVKKYTFSAKKKDYFCTLARFSREKGQHIAARLCQELGFTLKMAGTIAGITSSRQLAFEIASPLSPYRNNDDFRY